MSASSGNIETGEPTLYAEGAASSFFRGNLLHPWGLSQADLFELQPRRYLESPELFGWLLPVDELPDHPAIGPTLEPAFARSIAADESLKQRALSCYLAFLQVHALLVDHHGWIFLDKARDPAQVLLRKQLGTNGQLAAQVFRFLVIAGLRGYSASRPSDEDYAYSRGFQKFVESGQSGRRSPGR
jgi:hypothetical protein